MELWTAEQEMVRKACEQPTLLDALVFVAAWEHNEANKRVHTETYFKRRLSLVLESYLGDR